MKAPKTQALIRILLVLGILVVVNFISVRFFGRLDLTAQGVYTLSDASRTLVGSLDDRVTVRAYFTEDLPAPYNGHRRSVLDMLSEYKAYGGGNFQFEFVNPAGEKGEREAEQQGIMPVQVQVVNEDRLEVKRGFMGLVMLYEDRKETLPVVQNLSTLEYDISSALKRLTRKGRTKIGYTQGHQEPGTDRMNQVSQLLQRQYELVPVDLSKNEPIPADLSGLLVIAPQTKFSDSAKILIDRFIMRGGTAAFLLNRMNASLQGRFAQPAELGLDDLLENYGIRVNADLVRDVQCANVMVQQQQGPFLMQSQVPYVFLPNASDFSADNVMVKNLQGVMFHFVSSLDTNGAAAAGVRTEILIRSSSRSGRQTGFMVIDPFQRPTPDQLAEKGIPLAASLEGSFRSYEARTSADVRRSPATRIIVVGDGDFMQDQFLGNRDNVTLFANIVDYLADDAGLITIRSKNVIMPPLEPVAEGTRQTIKYANLVVPPLLMIGYGLFRWRRRIALKKALEAQP
jgi:gliding-associated putative ABC transporter substrate-binding component GldG